MDAAERQSSSRADGARFGLSTPRVSEEQLASLRQDGFLKVEGLSTSEEITSLQAVYDGLFTQERGWEAGDLFDMVGDDSDPERLSLPQMLWPSRYEPGLRQTRLARSAEAIARQILGPGIENFLEHAILKPPRHPTETPWHQDQAFSRQGSGFVESISIWMPLQDVTVESGCMRYIAGSNRGPLYPHRSPRDNPRIHGLELVSPPDLTHNVEVPLKAGDAVIHLSYTIHGAGGNSTDRPRRAYVLGYAVRSRKHQRLAPDYPWNLEKQTAREQRELQSLPPLKRTIRRLRQMLRERKF